MMFKSVAVLTMAVTAVVAGMTWAAAPGGGRGPGGGAATPAEDPVVLPKSIPADGKPQINGPLVTGSNLGHLFLYRIPATGDGPLTYAVDNLPAGLTLDAAKGVISRNSTGS